MNSRATKALSVILMILGFFALTGGILDVFVQRIIAAAVSEVIEQPFESYEVQLRIDDTHEEELIENDIYTISTTVEPEETIDPRNLPRYEVYKNGWKIDVPVEYQWYLHDICEKYGFNEYIMAAQICTESTWTPWAVSSTGCTGLGQISSFWVTNTVLTNKGYYDDYYDWSCSKSEWLKNPYHNMNTMMSIYRYIRDAYNLDMSTDVGYIKLMYSYATGKNPSWITSFGYANTVFGFRNEIIKLQE